MTAFIPLPEPKSRQEAFDGVWQRITAQGCGSTNEMGGCYYRSQDGRACSIGQFLDDKTAKAWDGRYTSIDDASEEGAAPSFMAADRAFYRRLQIAHDNAAGEEDFVGLFQGRMRKVAARYRLTAPAEAA